MSFSGKGCNFIQIFDSIKKHTIKQKNLTITFAFISLSISFDFTTTLFFLIDFQRWSLYSYTGYVLKALNVTATLWPVLSLHNANNKQTTKQTDGQATLKP